MNLLKGRGFLKFAALVFALFTYFYIMIEVHHLDSEKKSFDPSYKLIKLTAKKLPIKIRLATAPPDGYRIVHEQVAVKPSEMIVIGPEVLLDGASGIETALVDISESTRTVVKKIPLESVAGAHLAGDPYAVEVTVPIEKNSGD